MGKRGQATRRERFLPYRYERFGLVLNPVRCVLDGTREIEAFQTERHLIDLSDYRFDTVALVVRVEVPVGLFEKVLPPAERQEGAARVVLALRCPKVMTRRALSQTVGPHGSGDVEFSVELFRRDVVGSLDLVPYLVRKGLGTETEGYAHLPGTRLASARPWEVRFDLLRTPGGDYLDIRYVSFREQPEGFASPESIFQLDVDRENPVLWLNLDHPQVCEVLDNNANVGMRAQIRDVFFDYVSHVVWSRLFHKAAADLKEALPGDYLPFEWEDNVLRELLPVLYAEEANHESRRAALRRDLEQSDHTVLLQRLDAVLQARLDVPKHMTRLAEARE